MQSWLENSDNLALKFVASYKDIFKKERPGIVKFLHQRKTAHSNMDGFSVFFPQFAHDLFAGSTFHTLPSQRGAEIVFKNPLFLAATEHE